jgi:putative NADH-flavin reductase
MGELDDIEAMRIGMRGCDAVVCTVGVLERRPNTILSDGTRNLLKVAAEEEIRRVLVVTTLGLGDTRDQAHPLFRYLVRPVIRHSFADKERQEQAVMRSDLDWTLVRPAALTNGERTGAYRHGQDRSIRGRISRRDVADFLLRQLDDESYVRRAVAVAY